MGSAGWVCDVRTLSAEHRRRCPALGFGFVTVGTIRWAFVALTAGCVSCSADSVERSSGSLGDAGADVSVADARVAGDAATIGDDGGVNSAMDASTEPDGASDASVRVEAGACNVAIQSHAIASSTHVMDCSPVTYATSPPSSGLHYFTWALYRVYTVPVPLGSLVHNLEHGAVILFYNCPSGCADELARARAFVDSLPVDPICPTANPFHRVILVPDPSLDVRFAASAWGWTLRADCFDEAAFAEFVAAHYGEAPENICGGGWNYEPTDGMLALPPSCADGG